MEELKPAVRIQIIPPPASSPAPEPEKLESPLRRAYTVLLVLTFVFSAVSLYLSFAA